mgnify:CR=1 FL=1
MKKSTKTAVIILHGWGLRGSVYDEITALLKKEGFTVYSLDLPGFGSEKLKKRVMNLNDYVNFVRQFIKKKSLKNFVLLGHSFGGRVSIKFAATFPKEVRALILTGAPGIKQKLSFLRRTVRYVAVSIGELFRIKALLPLKLILRKALYFLIGEWDYYNSGDLRETFKKVIDEDLAPILPKVKVKTLIVWGENDTVVPLSVGKEMKKCIIHSKLIVLKNTGHKVPYEKPKAFFQAVLPFLKTL